MKIIGQQLGEVTMFDKAKYLLEAGVAILVFRKKNGELRVMLCTRNFQTAKLLDCDVKLNSKNTVKTEAAGNLIVTDLIIRETRQVNISRILYSCWFGMATTQNDIEMLFKAFKYIREQWENYDELDPIRQSAFFKSFHFTPKMIND